VTTAEARAHLIAKCDAAYHAARGRGDGIRDALIDAELVVKRVPDDPDVLRWLAAVLAALTALRANFDRPGDDEGWELGAIATVRRFVEELRDELTTS